jgi:hypothetical protein
MAENVADPCNSYSWSIVFLLIMALSFIFWILATIQIIKSRRSCGFSGLDRLLLLLVVASLIQFGPMLASTLHSGHGVYSYSQTSCKLMFYTEYGTRNLIAFLVMAILGYSWMGVNHGFDSVDGKIRDNMGWVVVVVFAVQGVFGIAPAVYLDVGLNRLNCVWAYQVSTPNEQVAMEIMLRPIVPYVIPSLLMIYPIIRLIENLTDVEETNRKVVVKISIILAITYIAFNSLYALILLVEHGLQLSSSSYLAYLTWFQTYNGHILCNSKWAFHLFHQMWFCAAPLTVLLVDPALGNIQLLERHFPTLKAKLARIYDDRVRLV